MKTAFLCAIALGTAIAASGQTSITVGYDQTVTMSSPGATAAFALNTMIADASAADGVVQIHGVAPGSTSVIVVSDYGTATIRITVLPPPVLVPAGLLAYGSGAAAEAGSIESRYASDPRQLSNALDLRQQHGGDSFEQLRVVTATTFDSGYEHRFGVPFFSYEIARRRRDFVLGDKTLTTSLLTVNNATVRGLHVREGDWSFNAGVSSVASFQGYFFATDPEYVAGVTRRFRITDRSDLAANLFYFKNPRQEEIVARSGPVASLVYTLRYNRRLNIRSEVGVSRGIGAALQATYEDERRHLNASLRYVPRDFASLAVESQRGTFADIDYAAALSERLHVFSTLLYYDYNQRLFQQRTTSANARASYRLSKHFSAIGAVQYTDFQATTTTPVDLRTISLSAGGDAVWPRFNAGAEYQPTWDLAGRRADGYSGRVGAAAGSGRLSAYYRHGVDLPTLTTFFTSIPGLRDALDRAGIYITDPNQLIRYLQDAAFLSSLGFGTLDFTVAPSRDDLGFTADWLGTGQRFNLNVLDSTIHFVSGRSRLRSAQVSYTLAIDNANEVTASAAAYKTGEGHVSTPARKAFGIAIRHRFSSVPPLMFQRPGDISGHVFVDDTRSGTYDVTKRGIADAIVALDMQRTTRTDANGFYRFDDVAARTHRVSVSLPTTDSFSLTGDSPRQAQAGEIANFGVAFLQSKIFGRILNDAGAGVPGVLIMLDGAHSSRRARSADDGTFAFDDVPSGPYFLSTAADSYPAGYDLQTLLPWPLKVLRNEPLRLQMEITALRSISGIVNAYDVDRGSSAPLAGATVTIRELGRSIVTGANGRYRFTDLPAGTYTVEATYGGKSYSRAVVLGESPAAANIDLIIAR